MDRFWIDPDRGFAVPRRVYNWGPGKPQKFEFRHRDYGEVKPGLWLPFTQIEDKYASIVAEREAIWGKVAARSEYRLRSIEFDSLPDNFFDTKLPPGTRVLDQVHQRQYAVSGDNDNDPFPGSAEPERKLESRQIAFGGWIVCGAVCVLLTLVVIWLVKSRSSWSKTAR